MRVGVGDPTATAVVVEVVQVLGDGMRRGSVRVLLFAVLGMIPWKRAGGWVKLWLGPGIEALVIAR